MTLELRCVVWIISAAHRPGLYPSSRPRECHGRRKRRAFILTVLSRSCLRPLRLRWSIAPTIVRRDVMIAVAEECVRLGSQLGLPANGGHPHECQRGEKVGFQRPDRIDLLSLSFHPFALANDPARGARVDIILRLLCARRLQAVARPLLVLVTS